MKAKIREETTGRKSAKVNARLFQKPHSPGRSPTGLELFAGAGGLALGGALAGLHHLALLDIDKFTCKMLEANATLSLPGDLTQINPQDIRSFDFTAYKNKVDIISGGPPCQPFSSGGIRKGQGDPRDMFPHAVRSVREVKPKAFLFENVAGLYQGRFNDYREYVKLQLEHPSSTIREHETWLQHRERLREAHLSGDAEYRVVVKDDVSAANYGVAQNRERILFIGIRSNVKAKPYLPRETHSEARLLIDQWVTGEYWDRHKIATSDRPSQPENLKCEETLRQLAGDTFAWRTLRDIISDLPEPTLEDNEFGHSLIPGARSYHGHDGSSLDWVSKALKAGVNGVPGGENCLRLSDGNVRYFTLRECARIQGFQDEYIIPDGPWTRIMKAFGNAVPVPVAQQFVSSLIEAIRV
jgi:DNA (cytosine-5)-methyltransferase 1